MSSASTTSLATARANVVQYPHGQLLTESTSLATLAAMHPVNGDATPVVQANWPGCVAKAIPLPALVVWLQAPTHLSDRLSRLLALLPVFGLFFKDAYSTRHAGLGGAAEVYFNVEHKKRDWRLNQDPMCWAREPPLPLHGYRNRPVLQGNLVAQGTTGYMASSLPYTTFMAKKCFGHGAAWKSEFPGLGALLFGVRRFHGILCLRGLRSSGERLS
jgi:hypothetical protein